MNSDELSQLKEVLHDTINESTKIATAEVKQAIESHSQGDDHRFVKAMRLREKRKAEMWDKVRGNVLTYFIWSVVVAGSVAVWQYVKNNINGGA